MALLSSSSLVLLALGLVVFYAFHVISLRQRMKGARNPPGPKGWPLVGNAPELASSDGNLLPMFARWAKAYGPIAEFSILGEKQVVLSSDRICNDLFVKRGAIYSDRGIPHAMRYITRDMSPALMSKNDSWRRERKLIHTTFSITANTRYQNFMLEEAALTLSALMQTPKDFDKHFQRYCYGVLTRSILGFRTSTAEDQFVLDTEAYINESMKCFRPDEYPSNVFPFLRWLPVWMMPSLAKMEKLRDQTDQESVLLRRRVEKQIADEKSGVQKKDSTSRFESVYRQFLEDRDSYDATDQEAGYAFSAMVGAGTRSPHNGLLTLLILMMEYPEWQKKLQKEVDEVVGGERLPTFEDIPKLPTVRAVVKEGIRYRGIVAELGIPHRLEEDDIYEGYFFPKGTVFFANTGSILMEKETYPDQLPFNPSRWLDPSYPTYREPLTEYPNCKGFSSFGYGRRSCPGADFAERTLVIMLAMMAWGCEVQKPLDEEGREVVVEVGYEPVPNPKPLPFPCWIKARKGRGGVVERVVSSRLR